MAAEPTPQPESGDNWPKRVREFMAPFLEKLDELTNQLREDEESTQTAGWRRIYAQSRKTHRENVKAFLNRLKMAHDAMAASDVCEDLIKEAKEATKLLTEEHEAHVAGRRRLVDPITGRVEALRLLRDRIVRTAREAAENNPLHMSGLPDEVHDYLRQYPLAVWDDEQGTVTLG